MVLPAGISSGSPLTVSASGLAFGSLTPKPERPTRGLTLTLGEQVGDGRSGERRQQDAAAVVTGGDQHTVSIRPTDPRRVVDRGRSQAGGGLEQFELVDRGDDGACVAEQFVHRARLHRGVVAPLLDRRPDHDGAVTARHEVHRVSTHQPAYGASEEGSGAHGRGTESEDVALDRAHLGYAGGLEPGDAVQPGAGRQDDVVRGRGGGRPPGRARDPPPSVATAARSKATPERAHASTRAASRARLSTWWSPGTSMPPRTAGLRAGTSRRHSEPLHRRDSSPSECW